MKAAHYFHKKAPSILDFWQDSAEYKVNFHSGPSYVLKYFACMK